ncbi:hypothetical protein D3C84_341680 [compost metagenome]
MEQNQAIFEQVCKFVLKDGKEHGFGPADGYAANTRGIQRILDDHGVGNSISLVSYQNGQGGPDQVRAAVANRSPLILGVRIRSTDGQNTLQQMAIEYLDGQYIQLHAVTFDTGVVVRGGGCYRADVVLYSRK